MTRAKKPVAAGASPAPDAADPVVAYQPKPKEAAAMESYLQRSRAARPFVRLKADTGVNSIKFDHEDAYAAQGVLMNATGVVHSEEYASMVQTLGELSQKDGKVNIDVLNQHLAMVSAIAPRDSVESMLATQMVAIHQATMVQARRLRGAETIVQQDSNANALNKLARTFTTQVEALKRYRAKPEQKVIVEHQHVHVYPGSQAVVGTLNQGQGGGVGQENGDQPHVRGVPEREAMHGNVEALRPALPRPGSDGLERLSLPRSGGRSPVRAG